ncbi:NAD-dependent epimerase/dehydratase family protein [Bordetella petrii]|nr:NAD-dependent epimerase/dehydratase family protein [Bordetella petrii]
MKKVLIVGGLGAVGQCALEHFESKPDWQIVGVSRRKPPFPTRAEWVSVDLRDRADCDAKLSGLRGITHIAYTAVYEKPHVTNGWSEMDHVETNLAMLQNCVEVVERASPELKHVTIMQGTKAYGGHLGPFRQPARESDARYMGPNFYYNQMDWLADRQQGKAWSWTILRPQIVCGIALGSPLNIVSAIGVYAAISREYGMPLRFPGGAARIGEATDARLIARAMEWAGTHDSAANQVFNITNGDVYTWENVWPRIAELFGMEMAPPHPFSLARVMPQNEPIWDRVVARHGLLPNRYQEIVPSWQFADFLLGYGQRPNSHHMSTIKIRQAGFADCIDSEDMFVELVGELQRRRILPA